VVRFDGLKTGTPAATRYIVLGLPALGAESSDSNCREAGLCCRGLRHAGTCPTTEVQSALPALEDPPTAADSISANNDADSIPQPILELMAPDRKTIM
jgi:hypothetical protein